MWRIMSMCPMCENKKMLPQTCNKTSRRQERQTELVWVCMCVRRRETRLKQTHIREVMVTVRVACVVRADSERKGR